MLTPRCHVAMHSDHTLVPLENKTERVHCIGDI